MLLSALLFLLVSVGVLVQSKTLVIDNVYVYANERTAEPHFIAMNCILQDNSIPFFIQLETKHLEAMRQSPLTLEDRISNFGARTDGEMRLFLDAPLPKFSPPGYVNTGAASSETNDFWRSLQDLDDLQKAKLVRDWSFDRDLVLYVVYIEGSLVYSGQIKVTPADLSSGGYFFRRAKNLEFSLTKVDAWDVSF